MTEPGMTEAGTTGSPQPGAETTSAARSRRKRSHPAASARILVAGLSASAGIGLVAALAVAAPGASTNGANDVGTVATTPNGAPPAPAARPTIVIRRYVPIVVPKGAGPGTSTPGGLAPATPVTPPTAPRPTTPSVPITVSRGS